MQSGQWRTGVLAAALLIQTVKGNSPLLATSMDCIAPLPPAGIAPKSSPVAGSSAHLRTFPIAVCVLHDDMDATR